MFWNHQCSMYSFTEATFFLQIPGEGTQHFPAFCKYKEGDANMEFQSGKYTRGSSTDLARWRCRIVEEQTNPVGWQGTGYLVSGNYHANINVHSIHRVSLKNKFRKREVRAKTAEGFNSLCSLLFASLSGVTIPHIPLGTNRAATISVNASGLVNASSLWTRNFFVSRVQKTWSEDFVDPAKTWLLHENGFGNIALPEFLEFCLDPQHDSSLQHELFGPALSLFSYIAFHLDEGVGFLQRDGPELDYVATVFKNKRRAATNLKSVFAEQVAQKLWKGEDSYLKKEICFMMFFW